MTELTFAGVAPVPANTEVDVVVDNPHNPKEAYRIEETGRGIVYSIEEEPTAPRLGARAAREAPNYIHGRVTKAIVYAGPKTVLTFTQM